MYVLGACAIPLWAFESKYSSIGLDAVQQTLCFINGTPIVTSLVVFDVAEYERRIGAILGPLRVVPSSECLCDLADRVGLACYYYHNHVVANWQIRVCHFNFKLCSKTQDRGFFWGYGTTCSCSRFCPHSAMGCTMDVLDGESLSFVVEFCRFLRLLSLQTTLILSLVITQGRWTSDIWPPLRSLYLRLCDFLSWRSTVL